MKKSKGKYPKRMKFRRLTAVFMAAAVVLSGMALPSKTAEAAETEYEIYPSPHVMDYDGWQLYHQYDRSRQCSL